MPNTLVNCYEVKDLRSPCPTGMGFMHYGIEFKHALLVDVRERDALEKLSLDVPDLLNIPMSEFEQRFAAIPRDREVVLVSANGQDLRICAYDGK